MENENFLLLKTHPCVRGLPDSVVAEIAAASTIERFQPGEYLHQAHVVIRNVDLIISGRLRISAFDIFGNLQFESFIKTGSQYGGMASALGEPTPVACVAEDPTTLLRLPADLALELTAKYPSFRKNLARQIAGDVKRGVLRDKSATPPRFVGVFHQSSNQTRNLMRLLLERLVDLGEEICVMSDQPDWQPMHRVHHRYIERHKDGAIDETAARQQIREWSDSPRLFVDVDASIGHEIAARILHACDLVLWFVTPDNWQETVAILSAVEAKASSWKDKICIIWSLGNAQTAPRSDQLTKLANRDIKISLMEPGPQKGQALKLGFERLVHLVRGVQIGVALGGGAARGMAHLGVLRALEEQGIVVDMIAGTSAGAMTGTLYASGMDVDHTVDCFCRDLRPSWFFRSIPKGDQWYLLYKYRAGHFDPMLRKYLADLTLEQLAVPMNSVTVDLISGTVVVRDVGDAVDGIIESINLPGLSLPVMRAGQALIDGGMINNVPADVLVAKKCNFVIAVSVTAKMEMEFARNRPDTPAEKMKRPSTLQTMLRTYLVQSTSVNAIGVQPADVVVEPDVTQFQLTDFVKTDQLADIGEASTLEAIPKIQQHLSLLDPALFPLSNT